jgi:hypothetical protein
MINRVIVAAAVGVFFTSQAAAQVEEYRLKATFLYNFAKFVQWPPESFKDPSEPISICILGQNPFGKSLDEAISGKVVDGRALRVREISKVDPDCECQILFVASSEEKRFRSFFQRLKGSGLLTVGETGLAPDGIVITMKLGGGKVHLEINLAAAECQNLRVSSKLLSLAQVIRRTP